MMPLMTIVHIDEVTGLSPVQTTTIRLKTIVFRQIFIYNAYKTRSVALFCPGFLCMFSFKQSYSDSLTKKPP